VGSTSDERYTISSWLINILDSPKRTAACCARIPPIRTGKQTDWMVRKNTIFSPTGSHVDLLVYIKVFSGRLSDGPPRQTMWNTVARWDVSGRKPQIRSSARDLWFIQVHLSASKLTFMTDISNSCPYWRLGRMFKRYSFKQSQLAEHGLLPVLFPENTFSTSVNLLPRFAV
jgi:hypothetical protein